MKSQLSSVAQSLASSKAVEARRRADDLAATGMRIIDLGFGEPDGDTPPEIKAAAIAAIQRGEGHYVDPRGLRALRERIADFETTRHGLAVDADQVVVTTGSFCALSLAFRAVLDHGDEAVILEPFWGPYAAMVRLAGGRPVTVPAVEEEGSLAPDFEALRRALSPHTKLIVLNSPNNPSGRVWTQAELMELGSICLERNLWIVSDEVYSELIFDSRHISIASLSPELAARTIVATSLSKSFAMTGWRLGYCIAPREVAGVLAKINHYTVRCATSFVQWGAITAFDQADPLLSEMRLIYGRRRDLVGEMFSRFPDFVYRKPQGTFYAFVKIPAYLGDSTRFIGRLLDEEGVIASAGSAYGPSAAQFMRLSFAASDEALEEGILRIGRLANRLHNQTERA